MKTQTEYIREPSSATILMSSKIEKELEVETTITKRGNISFNYYGKSFIITQTKDINCY